MRPHDRRARTALALLLVLAVFRDPGGAQAQIAKFVFGGAKTPSSGAHAAHGRYAAGCLAGGVRLPETGPGWQAMRLSRNRNWGHPDMIAFIERLSRKAQVAGWAGIYVGDISQPRGGPMLSGHASHQIGLDADIWLRPPVSLKLSRARRERISSHSVVTRNRLGLNGRWTDSHARVLEEAARDGAVARIFVNAAIKRRLCETRREGDARWLRKIRPWWGHNSHFHVRLHCPKGERCVAQKPLRPGAGCDKTLAWWFTREALYPPPPDPKKLRPPLMVADLPRECGAVLRSR